MLNNFVESHLSGEADLSLITAMVDDPGDYGRIRRDETGSILGIVETNDLLPGDRDIKEINAESILLTVVSCQGCCPL